MTPITRTPLEQRDPGDENDARTHEYFVFVHEVARVDDNLLRWINARINRWRQNNPLTNPMNELNNPETLAGLEMVVPVTAVRIELLCPICRSGRLEYTGEMKTCYPPLYVHQCTNCKAKRNLKKAYPRIEHRDVD